MFVNSIDVSTYSVTEIHIKLEKPLHIIIVSILELLKLFDYVVTVVTVVSVLLLLWMLLLHIQAWRGCYCVF